MCGVPIERADDYLQRLIALGHRVAVCEQIEDPAEAKKRGAKSVVKRDVVRLVTPGTITEERAARCRAAPISGRSRARADPATAGATGSRASISRPARSGQPRRDARGSGRRDRASGAARDRRRRTRCLRRSGACAPCLRDTGAAADAARRATGDGAAAERAASRLFRRRDTRRLRRVLARRAIAAAAWRSSMSSARRSARARPLSPPRASARGTTSWRSTPRRAPISN